MEINIVVNQYLKPNALCSMNAASIKVVEENHLGHFVYLPKLLGFDILNLDGVTIINCGLKSSMFNIAYGSPRSVKILDSIEKIKKAFAGKPFAWWIPPNDYKQEFTETLLQSGFEIETTEHAMICNAADNTIHEKTTDLKITPVTDNIVMSDFLKVLEVYDSCVNEFYNRINRKFLNKDEKLFVGYENDAPVTIGILFCRKDSAGIFSLITNEHSRGKGYGRDMMIFLMEQSKQIGCRTITLSASSDSGYRIYERLGFRKIGEFECFEYTGDK